MATLTVPEGCVGLEYADGRKPDASRPGGHIEVDDKQAGVIRRGWYGQNGVISGAVYSFNAAAGRKCMPCKGRQWFAWSLTCPSCGAPTVPA